MDKLNAAALQKIDEIVESHQKQRGPTIEMLHEVQNCLGYIPFEAMEKIADATNSSVAEVYGVVKFYSQFSTEPKGKHIINICLGTACYVKGSQKILDKICEELGVQPGECSADGMFSVEACRCIGACGLAPVFTINDEVYGKVTPEEVPAILAKYRNG